LSSKSDNNFYRRKQRLSHSCQAKLPGVRRKEKERAASFLRKGGELLFALAAEREKGKSVRAFAREKRSRRSRASPGRGKEKVRYTLNSRKEKGKRRGCMLFRPGRAGPAPCKTKGQKEKSASSSISREKKKGIGRFLTDHVERTPLGAVREEKRKLYYYSREERKTSPRAKGKKDHSFSKGEEKREEEIRLLLPKRSPAGRLLKEKKI